MEQLPLWPDVNAPPKHLLFFAIRPDPGAISNSTCLMKQLRNNGIMTGRPVDPDRLHVTLHWLGDFDEQIPPSLMVDANAVASAIRMQPFNVVFDRVGGRRGAFLIHASDGSETLRTFQQALLIASIRKRLPPPRRWRFAPHMTLSYDGSDVPERPIDPIRWPVRDFVLIESLLGEKRHIERGRWPIED